MSPPASGGNPARIAVVTGASSGIGAAVARALGEQGFDVALGARREDRLEDVAAEVSRAGGRPFAHPLDVSDSASVDRFFDAAEKRLGVADLVVNNAGISVPGRFHEIAVDDLRTEVTVNLLGPMYVVHRALPPLLERGLGGDLVFISSDAARAHRPLQLAYGATKAALEHMAHTLRMELEGSGIRVITLRVGPTLTEFGDGWGPERIKELFKTWRRFGLQRHMEFMSPDQVARAVVLAVTTPRGVNLDTIEIQPEAPREP